MNGLLNSRHLYTRFLIGQSQSCDVSSANQKQGGKWICRPHTVIYARWLDALMRAVCYLAAYIDDNQYSNRRFSPLYLSHESKRDCKVSNRGTCRRKQQWLRLLQGCEIFAESAVDHCAGDTLEMELSLITRKFQVCNEFSAFRKNYLQKLEQICLLIVQKNSVCTIV